MRCSCSKNQRGALRLMCYAHREAVCGDCVVSKKHSKCPVKLYKHWIKDGDYDAALCRCGICHTALTTEDDSLLIRAPCCYALYHRKCLGSYLHGKTTSTCVLCNSDIAGRMNDRTGRLCQIVDTFKGDVASGVFGHMKCPAPHVVTVTVPSVAAAAAAVKPKVKPKPLVTQSEPPQKQRTVATSSAAAVIVDIPGLKSSHLRPRLHASLLGHSGRPKRCFSLQRLVLMIMLLATFYSMYLYTSFVQALPAIQD